MGGAEWQRARLLPSCFRVLVWPGYGRLYLLALWEDSRLAALGLLDAAAVREACTRPLPPEIQFGVLDQVVAGEVWLRSLEHVPAPSTS